MEREIHEDLITINGGFEKNAIPFMPNWRIVITHSVDTEEGGILIFHRTKYLLRMLAGIWFTHNYFYHKPRWRPVVAGVEGRLPGMLKNPFCPGQVSRR